jgi:hypothetical protein
MSDKKASPGGGLGFWGWLYLLLAILAIFAFVNRQAIGDAIKKDVGAMSEKIDNETRELSQSFSATRAAESAAAAAQPPADWRHQGKPVFACAAAEALKLRVSPAPVAKTKFGDIYTAAEDNVEVFCSPQKRWQP